MPSNLGPFLGGHSAYRKEGQTVRIQVFSLAFVAGVSLSNLSCYTKRMNSLSEQTLSEMRVELTSMVEHLHRLHEMLAVHIRTDELPAYCVKIPYRKERLSKVSERSDPFEGDYDGTPDEMTEVGELVADELVHLDGRDAREAVIQAFGKTDYNDLQAINEVPRSPGIIYLSSEHKGLVDEINTMRKDIGVQKSKIPYHQWKVTKKESRVLNRLCFYDW